jgi:hypothetical protein
MRDSSLETAVRRVGVMRQSTASKDVKTAEVATALEAVTRRHPMKIQKKKNRSLSACCSEL